MIFVVVSTGHFDPLIAECVKLHPRFDFLGQIGSSTIVPPFKYFRTAPHQVLEDHMREAELVVSHGGTGMLSTLYRLKKPAVVIPKQIRYGESNDGQMELARKWGELGMAIYCERVEDLAASIEKCRRTRFTFPEFASLGKHLSQEITPQISHKGKWLQESTS